MVYQISEKNQILLVLFMIVVLCAGKLFKDYLFRRGYIEGLTVIPQSNVILRRNATNTTTVTITLNLKLGADLPANPANSNSNNNITVTWPTGKGVTMSSTATHYTVSGMTSASSNGITVNTTSTPPTLTIRNGATQVNSGATVVIDMSGVSIASGTAAINDFAFTTTSSAESTNSVVTPILIQAPPSPGASFSESSSVQEIRNALNTVKARIDATTDASAIAELTNIQNALISVLAYTYGTIKEAGNVFNSGELYEAQKTAMQFIDSEKKRAAKNADSLKQDNLNKRRMAQINTYYTRNYEANTEVMKNIIYVSVALIVLAVLRNKDMIPASIGTLGVIFILTLGGIVIGTQVFDIIRRNDHDFDKYDWNFNEDEFNRKQLLQQNSDPANLSEMGMGMAPCYGPGCCNIGTKWNESDKKCVPVGSAVFLSGTLTMNINIKVLLTTADKITLSLPTGFTGASRTLTGGGNGTVSLTAPFEVTPTAAINANTIHTITISGLTTPSPSPVDKTIKVSTTKEPTEGSIYVMGI